MEHLISCSICVYAVYRPRGADELAYEISSLSTNSCGEIIYSELLVPSILLCGWGIGTKELVSTWGTY